MSGTDSCHDHRVDVGGLTKAALLLELQRHAVAMNDFARTLFADERFTTSSVRTSVKVAHITVGGLGFGDGAVLADIVERAAARGLGLCPLELGPHLRLQWLDQPEGRREHAEPRHQAPFGSLTLISPRLTADTDFPAGFYLRRIDGVLWLRGYTVDSQHVWNPEDHLLFVQQAAGISSV